MASEAEGAKGDELIKTEETEEGEQTEEEKKKEQEELEEFLLNNSPPGFLCPLSLALFKDPVLASDGLAYDKPSFLGMYVCVDACVKSVCLARPPSTHIAFLSLSHFLKHTYTHPHTYRLDREMQEEGPTTDFTSDKLVHRPGVHPKPSSQVVRA
jgi:hypothetical protein